MVLLLHKMLVWPALLRRRCSRLRFPLFPFFSFSVFVPDTIRGVALFSDRTDLLPDTFADRRSDAPKTVNCQCGCAYPSNSWQPRTSLLHHSSAMQSCAACNQAAQRAELGGSSLDYVVSPTLHQSIKCMLFAAQG